VLGNSGLFKEPKLPDVQQHSGVVLCQQGQINGAAAFGDVIEADLIAENGLSRAGRALHYEDAAAQQATT
jgi:hypothetical protein